MPVIEVDFNDLRSLMGKEAKGLEKERFLERVPMIGSDVEDVDGNLLQIEFFPDRPDLYSVEGIARAMAAFLDMRPGLRVYDVSKPKVTMVVDPSVADVRPYAVGAIIRNVSFNDSFIKSLMDVQEKLHGSMGRNRKKVSIGIHDIDQVEPPFTYKAVDPESITFVPLAMQEELDMHEILRKHDKGIEYAWILENLDRYPIIVDSNDDVLSFPPIINGEITTVREDTKNLFIDVTGLDMNGVQHALNILCAMFVDRGAKIEAINMEYPDKGFVSPNMHPQHMRVSIDNVNTWLGTAMGIEDIMKALSRMGHKVKVKGKELEVSYPPYRKDILHPVDLIEDVAIGHGYENFSPELPLRVTTGRPRPVEVLSDRYRMFMIGMGYLETTTLSLSNDDDEFTKMGCEIGARSIIKNPTSENYSILRVGLIPSLLRTLRANKHRDLPQRIFEIDDVVLGHKNVRHIAALSVHDKASFTEMKSLVKTILEDLRIDHRFVATDASGFMQGRCASLITNNEIIGRFGEISPQTISNFELEFPIAGFEFRIQ